MFTHNDINVECNEREQAWLTANIDSIEGWPDDENRVRFVFKDGTKGKWFSRKWPKIEFVNVKPV